MAGCLLVPLQGTTALFGGVLTFGLCLLLGIVFMVRDAWNSATQGPVSDHYRGGVFYVNPQDPRLWVEKRMGVGWTLNFAHPAAPWVMVLLLGVTVGIVVAAVITVKTTR
jgi:hypothetical protein